MVGGFGFDGGYGGYNFGAPTYAQPAGMWPGQAPAPAQQMWPGQTPNMYGGYREQPRIVAPQQHYYEPQRSSVQGWGANIPSGAMYNGRPVIRYISSILCCPCPLLCLVILDYPELQAVQTRVLGWRHRVMCSLPATATATSMAVRGRLHTSSSPTLHRNRFRSLHS